MEPSIGVLRLLYAVATVLSAGLLGWVWTQREKRGAKPLLVALVGAVIWCSAPLGGTLSQSYSTSVLAARVTILGVVVGVFGLFLFMLEFTGREHWIRPRVVGLLAVEPVLAVGFAFANPGNLFFQPFSPDGSAWGVAVVWGPVFWVHALYSFGLLLLGSVFIMEFLVRSRRIYRWQAAALFLGTLVPWIGSLAHLVGPLSFNSTPLGIAIGTVLFAVAITRYGFIDVSPIARNRVFDTISAIVLVVDRDERVVDANPAARSLVGREGEQVAGEPFAEYLSAAPEIVELYREKIAAGVETSFELAVAGREYTGELSPIRDGRNRHVGWLIVSHDVTEQHRRQRELQRRNEQLDQFASIVSHDLRNPLNVAAARLELASEECDSAHLDQIAHAHGRMETIVEETLTLARLGETVDEFEPVDLGTALPEWWDGVDTAGASLDGPGELELRADPERLRQVFENLFRNAVDHAGAAGQSGPLTVTVGRCGPDCIYLADDGVGLPDDTDVFASGATTSPEGTGLGLAIVEKIVAAHGWEIRSTASAAGGARFELSGVDIQDGH